MDGARTFYGATTLSAEHLIEEYADTFGLRAVVNRCAVIAGPWQMGRVDQGVFSYLLLSHLFGQPLAYIGHGGSGKQVRDLLHVEDLAGSGRRAAPRPRALGGSHGERRGRQGARPLAARGHGALPQADRKARLD